MTLEQRLVSLVREIVAEALEQEGREAREERRWLSFPSLCAYLDVSEGQGRELIRRGLPKHKPGKALSFFLPEVDEWMAAR